MRGSGFLIAVCGAAALAAACGGDDRLSREELVAQADAICAKHEERLDALEEPESIEDVEAFAAEARPIFEEGVEELKDLEPPEDVQEDYDRWIELSEENVAAIGNLEQAAADGDAGRVQEIVSESQAKEQEADRLAQGIGLRECAND
jgi:hypothetical protein